MQIISNSYGSPTSEANDCHLPAGRPDGGQFCSTQARRAVPLDDVLDLVDLDARWSDDELFEVLDSYGIEGRGETSAQRARRERYGEGEGQLTLFGEWPKPEPRKTWKDLSVPERLTALGVEFKTIEALPGTKAGTVYVIDDKNRRLVLDERGGAEDASTWVVDTDPFDYIDFGNYNKEFWSSDPGETYHATSEENVERILREGLLPMNRTRGLGNQWTAPAVFTSSDIEAIRDTYGSKVFRIDLSAMRRDGYMPEVAEEGPIVEQRAKEALAHKIGLDNFYWEVEPGIEETTLVIFGHIPPKYLKLLED